MNECGKRKEGVLAGEIVKTEDVLRAWQAMIGASRAYAEWVKDIENDWAKRYELLDLCQDAAKLMADDRRDYIDNDEHQAWLRDCDGWLARFNRLRQEAMRTDGNG